MIDSLYTTVTQRDISIIVLFNAVVIIVVIVPFVAIKYNFIIFTIYLFDTAKVVAIIYFACQSVKLRINVKLIIDSLLLSIKVLLHGCLKSSFNVGALFNLSNILMFLFKSLLFSLKQGPCGLQLWATDSLSTLLELLLI